MQNDNPNLESDLKLSSLKNPIWIAWIALFCSPLTGAAIDIYVPSLPAIQQAFHADPSLVRQSITVYLIGFGGMQLVAGMISDSLGRRLPLLLSLIAFFLVTCLVTIAPSIQYVLLLRFLQGVTMAGISVSSIAIIPDLFRGKTYMKFMLYENYAWTLSPILAPFIGGYLEVHTGWKGSFYFLAAYTLIVFLFVAFKGKETHLDRRPFELKATVKTYAEIVSHKYFLGAVIMLAVMYGAVVSFSVIGPFLIQSVMHYSPVVFGYVALMLGVMIFLGNTVNKYLQRFGRMTLAPQLGLWVLLLSSIAMLIVCIKLPMTLWGLAIPIAAFEFGSGLIFPTYFAHTVALFPKNSASALALLGSLLLIGAGCMTAISGELKATNMWPLTIIFMSFALICLGIFYGLLHKWKLGVPET